MPEQLAQCIRQRKIREHLAVQASLAAVDFQPQSAMQVAVTGFGHLEFSHPALQFGRGQAHRMPEATQGIQILDGRPAHAMGG